MILFTEICLTSPIIEDFLNKILQKNRKSSTFGENDKIFSTILPVQVSFIT
jgi:hypothetical protein